VTEHSTIPPADQPDHPVDAVAGSELDDTRLLTDPGAPSRPTPDGERAIGAPLIEWLERQPRWEPVAGVADRLAERITSGARGPILRGEWLGHPLHPMLTDLPIGCWTSAMVLDLFAGRRSRPAAKMLVGAGVLSTLPTIAAGLADYTGLDGGARRVAVAHATGNAVATALYALSWRSRRRQHHLRGVALGLAGGTVASVAGYLGGHLAFAASDEEE
jgi:uncharacterized membrane protein